MKSSLDALEVAMSHLWAKNEQAPRYRLLQHLMDVCKQARDFYAVFQPRWPRGEDVDLARVIAYTGLMHDFGKIHVEFQAMLRGNGRFKDRHEVLSLAFLGWLEIPELERKWLAATIASHHRGLLSLLPRYQSTGPGTFVSHLAQGVRESDAILLYDTLGAADDIFAFAGWPAFTRYEMEPYFRIDYSAAVLSQMRQIGGFRAIFEAPPQFSPGPAGPPDWANFRAAIYTRGWLINADHLASLEPRPISQALASVSSTERQLRDAISARAQVNSFAGFNEHQCLARDTRGSALLTAPTGSGKSEAALLWAAAQAESGGLHGRVYMVLPYQASMNAMQQRLVRDLYPGSVDLESWTEHVALVHGRSARRAFEALLDSGETVQKASDRAHFISDLARLNAAPIVVCSPFALIKALFATKGAEALLASLSEARIALDEVHAYDVDVTAMTLATLKFLVSELGARVLLMTATIPEHLRSAIHAVLPAISDICASPEFLRKRARHRLGILRFDALSREAEELIESHLRDGSVLVVVNQIRRAIRLFESLRKRGHEAVLLHGRFNYRDRARHEGELKPERGRVLVSTQAVEVSLDIDYDVCLSELAPMESLLQRFGRCNRYGSKPPADVFVFQDFPGGGGKPERPYETEHLNQVLEALRWHLANSDGELAESNVPILIERSYPESQKAALKQTISRRCSEITKALIYSFRPFGFRDAEDIQMLEREWERLFDGGEILPASLVPLARAESCWLARARYLVPVSGNAFVRLKSKWSEDLNCFIAESEEAEYDPIRGLVIR